MKSKWETEAQHNVTELYIIKQGNCDPRQATERT